MASTSALTWAAARSGEPDWKFLGSLTPTDHAKIEIAYQEWRARIAAGEKRPQIDWRAVEVPEPEAKVVAAEAVPAVPLTVDHTEAEDVAPWEDEPDVADAVAQMEDILSEPVLDPDYVSLDDFNLEPSEDEMKAMLQSAGSDLVDVEQTEESESDTEEATVDAPEAAMDALEEDNQPDTEAAVDAPETAVDAIPIEQRISRLPKDADETTYKSLLTALGNDVAIAKDVVSAVIRDHTRRHRGTAAQRQFLQFLENK